MPTLLYEVNEITGFDVKFDILWNSMLEDGKSHLFIDSLPKIYFEPLKKAFSKICADDLGKKHLKESLQSVKMTNKSGIYSPKGIKYADGVLTIVHTPYANISDISARSLKIEEDISKAL